MLKKFLCILLVLTFTIMCTAEVFAEDMAKSCVHARTIEISRVKATFPYDSEQHIYVFRTIKQCLDCGAIWEELGPSNLEDHTLNYSDLGHVGLQHRYRRRCSCKFDETFLLPCSGPPCPYPF